LPAASDPGPLSLAELVSDAEVLSDAEPDSPAELLM
jgi:hypothetical protein